MASERSLIVVGIFFYNIYELFANLKVDFHNGYQCSISSSCYCSLRGENSLLQFVL